MENSLGIRNGPVNWFRADYAMNAKCRIGSLVNLCVLSEAVGRKLLPTESQLNRLY